MDLSINLKNCYGIGCLQHTIKFDSKRVAIIYAPNGTMKTSLTRTFENVRDGQQPKDLHYKNRETLCEINIDGQPVDPGSIYIFKNEDYDGSSSLNSLLADKKLKDEFDAIYSELNEIKSTLTRKLKKLAQSSDCEEEIISVFKRSEEDNFFDCLRNAQPQLETSTFDPYPFRYNDIFDKAGKVKKFIRDHQNLFQDYMLRYQEITKDSPLYTAGEAPFGTTQASVLLKSVEDNRYFMAEHRLKLKNGCEIINKKDLEELINAEANRISEDEKLKKQFIKIDSALGKNGDLRLFKDVLERNPSLVAKVLDYEHFQQEVLLGYLKDCQQDVEITIDAYNQNIEKLKEIQERASAQSEIWQAVVELFNDRFFVPFKVAIENKADVLLKDQAASLAFKYEDGNDEPVHESKDVLLNSLSRGEQKAFFILQNLFSIEERKQLNQETLLIFDDVADSFDYKNKYAIIEYLADLQHSSHFRLLILTHNFDFYRTVVSRLSVSQLFLANKDDSRRITLELGFYRADILKHKFIKNINDRRSFIGLIPFVRNMYEYIKGSSSEEYIFLTSCLHIKEDTESIKLAEIKDKFEIIEEIKDRTISFGDEFFKDALFQEADQILQEASKENNLADKLVLSMSIRLKAEEYMIKELEPHQCMQKEIKSNQTAALLGMFKKHCPEKKDEYLLINKVVMLTSENIHVNNFMFEPLIDISNMHLKKLYKEVKRMVANGV